MKFGSITKGREVGLLSGRSGYGGKGGRGEGKEMVVLEVRQAGRGVGWGACATTHDSDKGGA